MAQQVVNSALCACSFGVAPVPLVVTPENKVLAGGLPAATIMDNVPMKNIASFGMCSAPTNPAVIAATSAALGVFTPAPCVPVFPAPWVPGSPTVMIGGKPALSSTSKVMCSWMGVVQVSFAGQVTTNVP